MNLSEEDFKVLRVCIEQIKPRIEIIETILASATSRSKPEAENKNESQVRSGE